MSAAQTTYVTAIRVDELFADVASPDNPNGYQRELDRNRARAMSMTWDPRRVGVIDVSDRGTEVSPRFAIINGQHRWWAAVLLDPSMSLVCNVHTGLSVADEAKLFWDIDRTTKHLQVWDRWYARRAAGDPVVVSCDRIARQAGLQITHNPKPDALQCFAAIEFVHNVCNPETLVQVLEFIGDVWPGDIVARRAVLVKALGQLLWDFAPELDTGHLADALSEMTPTQLIARGKDVQTTSGGALHKTIIAAAIQAYNRRVSRADRLSLTA